MDRDSTADASAQHILALMAERDAARAEITRLRKACAVAAAALVGPADEYEGCDEALYAVREALGLHEGADTPAK